MICALVVRTIDRESISMGFVKSPKRCENFSLTLGNVDILARETVKGRQGCVHINSMLKATEKTRQHLARNTNKDEGEIQGTPTELRTLLKFESLDSMHSFLSIKSGTESLNILLEGGAPPDDLSEGTVGVWILSSMEMPIIRKLRDVSFLVHQQKESYEK